MQSAFDDALAEALATGASPKEALAIMNGTTIMSAIALKAIEDIAQKYDGFGKKIKLRHLSKDCHKLLSKTGQLVVDSDDDPDYSLAVDYGVNLKIFNK